MFRCTVKKLSHFSSLGLFSLVIIENQVVNFISHQSKIYISYKNLSDESKKENLQVSNSMFVVSLKPFYL